MFKRILITGANGFLASSMAAFLEMQVPQVVVTNMVRPKPNEKLPGGFLSCAFEDSEHLDRLLRDVQPEVIFHFAGGRYSNDEVTFHANVTTTRLLLASLARIKLNTCRVILPGSAAEYGNLSLPKITEDCLAQPLSWYGLVKLMQTQLGLFAARNGQEVLVARMFNILGARTPSTLAMGMFAKQIVAIEQGAVGVIKTKNLDGYRDFLDIEDVCAGLWGIAQFGVNGEIYNLCSEQAITIGDLLKHMLTQSTASGIDIQENKHDTSASFNVIGSCQKLHQLIGWKPKISITQSVENTLASYRQHAS